MNKRLLYLDSVSRSSGSVQDLVYNIHPQIDSVEGYEILDFDISRNVIYNIGVKCNKLSLRDTNTNLLDITIDVRGYSECQLAREITKQINLLRTDGKIYTVVYNPSKSKYTFTVEDGTFDLLTTNTTNSLYSKLGFNTDTDKTGLNLYEGENSADINSMYFIYLQSRNITNILLNPPRRINLLSNSLHRVKINSAYGGEINKVDISNPVFIKCNGNRLSELDIKIVDKDGDLIDMNGINYTLTIMVYYNVN